jgi:hypothetical protein
VVWMGIDDAAGRVADALDGVVVVCEGTTGAEVVLGFAVDEVAAGGIVARLDGERGDGAEVDATASDSFGDAGESGESGESGVSASDLGDSGLGGTPVGVGSCLGMIWIDAGRRRWNKPILMHVARLVEEVH